MSSRLVVRSFRSILVISILLFGLSSEAQAQCVSSGVNEVTCSGNANGYTVIGTGGNERFIIADGTTGNITIVSGGGTDELDFSGFTSGVTADLSNQAGFQAVAAGLNIWFQGFTSVNIIGGQADDTLTGTGGDDDIDGGPGVDDVDGGAGTDTQSNSTLTECSADTVANFETDACPYVTIDSIAVPADGTYEPGDALDVTVTYSDAVTVTGVPFIPLTIGASSEEATFVSGDGGAALLFRYVVQAGDSDSDGIEIGAAIDLNGGSIEDDASSDVPTSLAGAPSTAGVRVAAPLTLDSVTVPADGTYYEGNPLDFTVTFSDPITVTGTPSIPLTIGAATRAAAYVSGSGSADLLFRYVVQAADVDSDGIEVGAAIALNGGTIRDAALRDAPTSLAGTPSTAGVVVAQPDRSHSGASPTGTGTITASFTGGGAGCTFDVARFIPVSGDPASPPAPPSDGTTFPHGLFDFTTDGCTPGGTITMTVTYPDALPADTEYWKYGPTSSDPAPHWYTLPASIAGNVATFTIVDGELGDDDLTANGTIVDQGGPGVPPTPVPTLPQWMFVMLALAMGLVAVRALGRGVA